MKHDADLKVAGFTESGQTRYKQTVNEYSDILFSKSVAFGDADKADDAAREVTHDHVKAAAHQIAESFSRGDKPVFAVWCQVGEYISAAIAGLGAGKLDQSWGIAVFGICLTLEVPPFSGQFPVRVMA